MIFRYMLVSILNQNFFLFTHIFHSLTATEMVLPGQRVYVGVVLWYWYACGYFVLSALGRYLASWRVFIALTAVPFVFLIPSVL